MAIIEFLEYYHLYIYYLTLNGLVRYVTEPIVIRVTIKNFLNSTECRLSNNTEKKNILYITNKLFQNLKLMD